MATTTIASLEQIENEKNRWKGCLTGLACGDAIGTTVEFMERGSFKPMTDMVGGGPFGLKPGMWTDDTIMALCLAESLVLNKGFDPFDQMNRYLNWMNYGYMSPTGSCFDIGMTTQSALYSYGSYPDNPYQGSTHSSSSGNGGIMRLAPIPMFYSELDLAKEMAKQMSRTTHASEFCLISAEIFCEAIWLALKGNTKDHIKQIVIDRISNNKILQKIATGVFSGNFLEKDISQIKGSGFVLESLEAALWCFFNTDTFKDAVLTAVNLGDDADTTGAIVGQLAGAYYGYSAIPEKWRTKLYRNDLITSLSESLYQCSSTRCTISGMTEEQLKEISNDMADITINHNYDNYNPVKA